MREGLRGLRRRRGYARVRGRTNSIMCRSARLGPTAPTQTHGRCFGFDVEGKNKE